MPLPTADIEAGGARGVALLGEAQISVSSEELISCVLQISRALVGPGYKPVRIEFGYKRPDRLDPYREAFACPLRFEAKDSRLVFDAAVLKIKLPTADPTTHAAALRMCATQLGNASPAGDLVTALQFWMRERLGGQVRVAAAASALNLSERTLRRRLAESGVTFKDLFDQLRVERAGQLLRDPLRSVAAVGTELGFGDGREFRRAYKRWTGMTPQQRRLRYRVASSSLPGGL